MAEMVAEPVGVHPGTRLCRRRTGRLVRRRGAHARSRGSDSFTLFPRIRHEDRARYMPSVLICKDVFSDARILPFPAFTLLKSNIRSAFEDEPVSGFEPLTVRLQGRFSIAAGLPARRSAAIRSVPDCPLVTAIYRPFWHGSGTRRRLGPGGRQGSELHAIAFVSGCRARAFGSTFGLLTSCLLTRGPSGFPRFTPVPMRPRAAVGPVLGPRARAVDL